MNTYLLLNAQIGSQAGKGVGLGSIDFTGAPYEQEEMTSRIKLIDNNIRVIEAAIKKRVYDSSKSQLEKITIGQIFRQMGRDSGYIMGKILEAGALGYSKNKTQRDEKATSKTPLIGKQFPLKIDWAKLILSSRLNRGFFDSLLAIATTTLSKSPQPLSIISV